MLSIRESSSLVSLDPPLALAQEAVRGLAEHLAPRGCVERWVVEQIRAALPVATNHGGGTEGVSRLSLWLSVYEQFRRLGADSGGASGADRDAIDPSQLWRDRLRFDDSVSTDSPVVVGTTITVQEVVSKIVDGWRWSDLLARYPVMTEADIRACLAYCTEEEGDR